MYYCETGAGNVHIHAKLAPGTLDAGLPYYLVVRCNTALVGGDVAANADCSASFDGTFAGGAGQTVQFDGNTTSDGSGTYFLSPTVTL